MPIAPQTAKKTAKKIATKTSDPHLLAAIREGLQDVKDMRDGKQPKQTLKELLDEL